MDFNIFRDNVHNTAQYALSAISTIYKGDQGTLPTFLTLSNGNDYYNPSAGAPLPDALFVRVYYSTDYFAIQYGRNFVDYMDYSTRTDVKDGYKTIDSHFAKFTFRTLDSLEYLNARTLDLEKYIDKLREVASQDLDGFRRLCRMPKSQEDFIIQ